MGRPKGSLNKKGRKIRKVKCRKNKVKKEVVLPPSNVKKSKFLGYCPKCRSIVTKKDLESKFIFNCFSCGKRARIKMLKESMSTEKTPMTKKEYLEHSVNAEHIDMPPLHDLDPGELKVVS